MRSIFRQTEKKLKPYEHQIVIVISIIFALITRYQGIQFVSYDMGFVLINWYNYIVENGGFLALEEGFYNYNPPYIYLMVIATYLFKGLSPIIVIKLIALPFDFLAAFLAYKIVDIKYPNNRKSLFAFIAVLFAPTVVTNGAYWGQCDVIYTSFLLGSLYFLLIKKELFAFISFTIAFTFKLQAMFFAPVLFILFLKRYIRWTSFSIIPIGCFLALLPAYFAGRSMKELSMIYFGQINSDESLTILAPTLYQWIPNQYFEIFSKLGLILTAIVILIFSGLLYKVKFKLTSGIIIQIALISVILMPFFLPKMHERYFFAADVISIIFAFYYPKYFLIPVLINFSSLICYYPAHTGRELFPIAYLSFVILGVLIALIFHLARTIRQQNRELVNITLIFNPKFYESKRI